MIGSGHQTLMWTDNWLRTNPPRRPKARENNINWNTKVAEFIDHVTKRWDINKRNAFVVSEYLEIIQTVCVQQ